MVDDYDAHTVAIAHPSDAVWTKVFSAGLDLLRSAGADVAYGRKLATALDAAGLTDISAEGLLHSRPVPELTDVPVPILDRMREQVLASGTVSATEYEQVVGRFGDDSPLSAYSPTLVSARGRRPVTS